jgi:hypothetical protein
VQAFGRRDEHSHVAVAQDVGNLLRLQQRIERHEHRAGTHRAEGSGHELQSLFQIDADTFTACNAELDQSPGEQLDGLRKFAVAKRPRLVRQCGTIGLRQCRAQWKLMKQSCIAVVDLRNSFLTP